MPTVKIPVTRFRENHMGPSERDFLHVFAEKLIARGFRIGKTPKGRWEPQPALAYERTDTHLIVAQDVPGRVSDRNPFFVPLLLRVRQQDVTAIPELYAFLLSEGDDRAATLAALDAVVPQDAMMSPDSGGQFGRPGQEPGEALVSGETLAARMLCGKVLLLFGVREEAM